MAERGLRLAPYAVSAHNSQGRALAEAGPGLRGEFQRDRDRIVHSAAFRRLEYKTQVFVNHEGDMFRTRLTHSIEVAQIARSMARVLHLNEDLAESVALAHDLGHAPFGHAGQDALNDCMQQHGGFEHNLQSLRVVDELEERYADFNGLNLLYETREGILKHCSRSRAAELGALGQRFLQHRQPSLEAQLVNLADEIAYNNHDVDDGLRSGLITLEQLCEISLFRTQYDLVTSRYPDLQQRRVTHEVIRRMINRQVSDLVEASRQRITHSAPATLEDVRAASEPLVGFSAEMLELNRELKRFLRDALYQHYRVRRMSSKARQVIRSLYQAFIEDHRLLPDDYQVKVRQAADEGGVAGRARVVADYIAGMTDRYAIREFGRMFDPVQLT
ncbi:MAG: deoxyguanosinetriphosphate triphosphohydrolase [Gammaproteobacteria bacterium]|nr:deoxyguanosinetriphosphate triphosphohydrolase [Gammaproteobacteria bacterium]